ncbi:hypothetical protein [Saccharicrinis carchari]|uniref:hypothetical protein n=1 Tax=Saccharicrinis carchari TaxID=1168039 RepID=UPI00115A6104|nr:hypothetical protein [Saccharicrinis carchari]
MHTKIGGGPESAVYKLTDSGANWGKLTEDIPPEDMGGRGNEMPKLRKMMDDLIASHTPGPDTGMEMI